MLGSSVFDNGIISIESWSDNPDIASLYYSPPIYFLFSAIICARNGQHLLFLVVEVLLEYFNSTLTNTKSY